MIHYFNRSHRVNDKLGQHPSWLFKIDIKRTPKPPNFVSDDIQPQLFFAFGNNRNLHLES